MQQRSVHKTKTKYKAKANKPVCDKNWEANMPEFFTLLPHEMQEHIYFFLTNKELINVSTVNRFFHDSIHRHELPLRALTYIKKKLDQPIQADFYNSWIKKIDIQKDIDLILQVANKIHQEYSYGKTPASKVSETITDITHKDGFILISACLLLIYLFIIILVPLIHMLAVFKANHSSLDALQRDPDLQRYMNKGYLELEEKNLRRYYYISITGAGLILSAISAIAINELYKRFANDPAKLTNQIKKMSLEKKSITSSQAMASLFTKKRKIISAEKSEEALVIHSHQRQ